MRARLLTLACGVALPVAASGQAGPAQDASAGSGPPPVTTQAEPAAPGQAGGDIIVTAQRRSERLQDVPMAITALSAETLSQAGVTATPDLQRVTPGLVMNFYGGFLQPAIRGVTSAGANIGESSNVATYIDGIYQPQQIATLFELPDVEQVEVLKGPQGALYGQNATGGAILVTSAAPSFTAQGRASASYGNYGNVDLRGYVTVPLTSDLAFSLAGGYHEHDGFRRQIITGERDRGLDSKVVRGKLLFKPSEAAQLTLTGYYSDFRDSSMYAGVAYNNNSIGYLPDLSAVFRQPAGTFRVAAQPRPASAEQFTTDPGVFTRVKSWGTSLRGAFDVGAGKITALASYAHNEASYRADADYTSTNFATAYAQAIPSEYFIADANFASREFGPASFLAGAFFLAGQESFRFNSFSLLLPNLVPAAQTTLVNSNTFGKVRKRIVASYAEATLHPLEPLFITAGGRFTHEEQRGFTDNATGVVVAYPGNPVGFDRFTPRVTARYEVTADANVYASWGKGFKSGGINLTRYDLAPFRPENITAYEIGFKGRLAPRLRVNASAFLYDYKDVQIVQYVPPAYFEENAARARIKGADFDVNYRLLPGLTVTAGGTFLDAHYRQALATVNIPTGFGNVPTPGTNVSGNRLIRSPVFTGTLGASYEHDGRVGRFGAAGSLYHSSSYPMEIQNRIVQGRYTTVNAELSLAPRGLDRLRLVVWGKNLTDAAYLASLLQSQFADGVSYAEPRTYGVRAEFRF